MVNVTFIITINYMILYKDGWNVIFISFVFFRKMMFPELSMKKINTKNFHFITQYYL